MNQQQPPGQPVGINTSESMATLLAQAWDIEEVQELFLNLWKRLQIKASDFECQEGNI